jgi:hypothetical protein
MLKARLAFVDGCGYLITIMQARKPNSAKAQNLT